MNDNLLIETKEIGNHRIKIYYDAWGQSPITNSDMAARYLFEYNDCYHHILHEECNWKDWFLENRHSLEDALRYMAADVVKQKDIINYYKKVRLTVCASSMIDTSVSGNYRHGKNGWAVGTLDMRLSHLTSKVRCSP